MTMPLEFSDITGGAGARVTALETDLDTKLAAISATSDPSTGDLLQLQQLMQQWSMIVNLESSTIKEVADTMKGVIQKIG